MGIALIFIAGVMAGDCMLPLKLNRSRNGKTRGSSFIRLRASYEGCDERMMISSPLPSGLLRASQGASKNMVARVSGV